MAPVFFSDLADLTVAAAANASSRRPPEGPAITLREPA
jgi:hypothetical protein